MVGMNLGPGKSHVDLGSGEARMTHDFPKSPQAAPSGDIRRGKSMPKAMWTSLPRADSKPCEEPLEGQLNTCLSQWASAPHPNMEPIALPFQLFPDWRADRHDSIAHLATDDQVVIPNVRPSQVGQFSQPYTTVQY